MAQRRIDHSPGVGSLSARSATRWIAAWIAICRSMYFVGMMSMAFVLGTTLQK
jgi:hypothetical protein